MAIGKKTGGRRKGSRNKIKLIAPAVEAVLGAVKSGITPLEYMLKVMRDSKQPAPRRDDMARAAAPYVHAKAGDSMFGGEGGGPSLEELIGMSYRAGEKSKDKPK